LFPVIQQRLLCEGHTCDEQAFVAGWQVQQVSRASLQAGGRH
jgi:hypothetical protein